MKYIKQFLIFLFFLLPSSNFSQSDQFSNIVTGLEVTQIQSNIVSVEWKSDLPSGNFSIYYRKSTPIISDQDLKKSELASATNLKGTQKTSLYSYKIELLLAEKGDFYFAVVLEPNFDRVARGMLAETSSKSRIIPSLNAMVQAIQVTDYPLAKVQSIERQAYFLNNGYVITSLKMEKEKDFFRLRWFVYPKDLDQYVFIIYRSRYPIVNYSKPDGLPEYARVTNTFYFEDKNISIETPYYYAVVPEENKQWQRGLNVLNEPGVLMKDSPLFQIQPTVEYVKIKEPLPVRKRSE
ncbi:MAG: hypothetical protein ACRCTJ_00135, partial [Brevinema sp.]